MLTAVKIIVCLDISSQFANICNTWINFPEYSFRIFVPVLFSFTFGLLLFSNWCQFMFLSIQPIWEESGEEVLSRESRPVVKSS